MRSQHHRMEAARADALLYVEAEQRRHVHADGVSRLRAKIWRLRVAFDNVLKAVRVNGVATGMTSSNDLDWLPYFTITNGFVPGLNSLEFEIENTSSQDNPTGFRTEISGVANPNQPLLSIIPVANSKAAISWLTNFDGFLLEATGTLPASAWTPVTNTVATINNRFLVTVDLDAISRFFRLRKP
jgi:hypothetical protein